MKYFSTVLALTVLLMAGCSEENPLEANSGIKLDGLDPIPHAPRSVPFHASIHNSVVSTPPDPNGIIHAVFEGGGTATHLGEFTLYSTSDVNVGVGPPFPQTTTAWLTGGEGDEIILDMVGETTLEGGVSVFTGGFSITGTGRFSTASGEGTYAGSAIIGPDGTGEAQWEADGRISR